MFLFFALWGYPDNYQVNDFTYRYLKEMNLGILQGESFTKLAYLADKSYHAMRDKELFFHQYNKYASIVHLYFHMIYSLKEARAIDKYVPVEEKWVNAYLNDPYCLPESRIGGAKKDEQLHRNFLPIEGDRAPRFFSEQYPLKFLLGDNYLYIKLPPNDNEDDLLDPISGELYSCARGSQVYTLPGMDIKCRKRDNISSCFLYYFSEYYKGDLAETISVSIDEIRKENFSELWRKVEYRRIKGDLTKKYEFREEIELFDRQLDQGDRLHFFFSTNGYLFDKVVIIE